MNVISLKDYAKKNNISYEAVRKQVVRYQDELGSHVIRDGRQQLLDEEAVIFLDAKRQKNPVAIIQMDKDEQIEELENQVKQLLVKVAAQADRISELAQWKADNALLIAGAEHNRLALESSEKEKKILEGFIQDAKAEIEVQKAENDDLSAQILDLEQTLETTVEALETANSENEQLRQQLEDAQSKRYWWWPFKHKGE